MKSVLKYGTSLLIAALLIFSGCKKKNSGICQCKFKTGEEQVSNLQNLNDKAAQDSCDVISWYAKKFDGYCHLK